MLHVDGIVVVAVALLGAAALTRIEDAPPSLAGKLAWVVFILAIVVVVVAIASGR